MTAHRYVAHGLRHGSADARTGYLDRSDPNARLERAAEPFDLIMHGMVGGICLFALAVVGTVLLWVVS